MNIEARKIAIVKEILSIENEFFIKELEAKLVQLIPKNAPKLKRKKAQNKSSENKSRTPPITEIRKNVSLDTIVSEQQTVPITYEEIQAMIEEVTWEHSLEELLEVLN